MLTHATARPQSLTSASCVWCYHWSPDHQSWLLHAAAHGPFVTICTKGKGAHSSSWNSPQNYGTSLVNGITQCYLPPDRGDRPAFTPTGQVGTRFIDPVKMKGWVGLVGWLHTEMVYPSTDGSPIPVLTGSDVAQLCWSRPPCYH